MSLILPGLAEQGPGYQGFLSESQDRLCLSGLISLEHQDKKQPGYATNQEV